MAMRGYMESTLSGSEVFQGINNIPDQESTLQKAIHLIKTAKHVTNEDIEAAYIAVRQISDSLTVAAMRAFDEGRTVLIYNDIQSQSVTKALPFITLKTSGQFVTYVFVDNHITISRDAVMTMQAPILRDLLTGAVVANGLKRNYNTMASSAYLQGILMEIYTKFVTRIINREFAIMADKIAFDTIQYWVNKFFLLNIFGTLESPESVDIVASKHFKYIDEIQFESIKQTYAQESPAKFSEMLNLLKMASTRMRSLNMGTFLSDWINYYYTPAMLAVDNIEYLIFMIITLLSGNNLISVSASDVVKEAKNIKSFRGELLKLI